MLAVKPFFCVLSGININKLTVCSKKAKVLSVSHQTIDILLGIAFKFTKRSIENIYNTCFNNEKLSTLRALKARCKTLSSSF